MKILASSVGPAVAGTLLFFVSVGGHAQQANRSLQDVLEQRLNNSVLSLRIPDPRSKLQFDQDGRPSDPRHGVVSLDRDLVVRKVNLSDGRLKIEGRRIYYSWNAKSTHLEAKIDETAVEVDLDLPAGNASEASIATIFNKVFEAPEELQQATCSSAESESSKPYLLLKKVVDTSEKNATSRSDLKSLCLPSGVRGYLVARGVTPPRAVSTPDPVYGESARQRKIQGTVVLAVVVDESGLVRDLLLVRPLEPKLNYSAAAAVRNWRFKPATFLGQPVPVAINVEVNFRLY